MKKQIVIQVKFSVATKSNGELEQTVILDEGEAISSAWTQLVGELFSDTLPDVKMEEQKKENMLLTDGIISIALVEIVEIKTSFFANERRPK
jgi:hypothetical protein